MTSETEEPTQDALSFSWTTKVIGGRGPVHTTEQKYFELIYIITFHKIWNTLRATVYRTLTTPWKGREKNKANTCTERGQSKWQLFPSFSKQNKPMRHQLLRELENWRQALQQSLVQRQASVLDRPQQSCRPKQFLRTSFWMHPNWFTITKDVGRL